ncbi:MAG: sodium:solute symporter family protein [Acidobacteriota bacterium]|nr:sodium:solute symporter family protein [Acidobacteriota bacterium]
MITAGVLIYLALLAVVGVRQLHRTRTSDDFLVAGRSLAAPVLACTLLAAWIGSGSLFAGAGLGYRVGFAALWQSAGAWAAIAIIWHLAPRVRALTVYTVPDIFERHYGIAARRLASATIVIAYTAIVAFQFGAGGRLFALLAGIDTSTGIFIAALLCIGMTAVAGLRSVAWVDAANTVALFLGLGLAATYLYGYDGAAAVSRLRPDQLTIFGTLNPVTDALALFLPALVLLLGDAGMYQKLSSARTERAARWGVAGWFAATVVAETLIVCIAVLGSAVLPGLAAGASDTIVIRVAMSVLPAALGVLLAAAAAAIIVSTANTFLLAAATSLVHDMLHRGVAPPDGDRAMWVTRYAIASLGIAALVLLQVFPGMLALALWTFTMYGAVITPPLMAAFFWPRVTGQGALAGMLTGMTVTVLVQALMPAIPAIFPALILSTTAMVAVSLRTAANATSPSSPSSSSGSE